MIQNYSLEQHRFSAQAVAIEPMENGGFLIHTTAGDVFAEFCVVAIGLGTPYMPGEGPETNRVMHAFDFSFLDNPIQRGEKITVVGGGLSAGTIAVNACDKGAEVELVTRTHLTVSQLEADPEWLPGRSLHDLFLLADKGERGRQLKCSRIGRGVTPKIWRRLMDWQRRGRLRIVSERPVTGWRMGRGRKPRLNEQKETSDKIICATGARIDASQISLFEPMQGDLEIVSGVPVIDGAFESLDQPRLFFMGRLGEYQGGPLSRNIPGAQWAAPRIVSRIQNPIY